MFNRSGSELPKGLLLTEVGPVRAAAWPPGMEPSRSDSPRRARRTASAGFTLVELLVVLVVLAAIAGLVVAMMGGVSAQSQQDVTVASLAEIRVAIMGNSSFRGFHGDLRQTPSAMADLLTQGTLPDFDPVTALGWRGPYARGSGARYAIDAPRGFTPVYGAAGDPAILDAWGNPVVIQNPDPDGDGTLLEADRLHGRLVSAGPDGTIQTPRTDAGAAPAGTAWFPARAACGDDLVLYLRVADGRP